MIKTTFTMGFLALQLLLPGAHAEDSSGTRMLAIASKNMKTSGAFANMLGVEYLNYHTDTFFMGGAVYTGQLSSGATGAVSIGGILAGAEIFQFSPVGMTLTVLLGGGGGFSATNGGGFVIDPTLGFNFKLGGKTKAVVDLGYILLPSSTTYSGLDISAKIVFPIG